jgi:hypothetical protein
MVSKKGSVKITGDIDDDQFLSRYENSVLERQSLLSLKTSFHLINNLLIGVCSLYQTMLQEDSNETAGRNSSDIDIDYTGEAKKVFKHNVDPKTYTLDNADQCIYEAEGGKLAVIEHAPAIFSRLRNQAGLTPANILDTFKPVNNEGSINNFFQGSGKSESFFFFTQNQEFVLKTMKASEMKLLLETDLLANYARHMRGHPDSLLSRFYGVYTFKLGDMDDIHCFITNNLIGKEFPNVERIYDLKGSTRGRRTKLSAEHSQPDGISGMKVLKDLNFIDVQQHLEVVQKTKADVLDQIAVDSKFLAENNLMDYSVLFIQFANKEIDTEQDMPTIQLGQDADGGIVFKLLKDTIARRMTTGINSSLVSDGSADAPEANPFLAIQEKFAKRLRTQT